MRLSSQWFENELAKLGWRSDQRPPEAKPYNEAAERHLISLEGCEFITFFEMLKLYLLLDACQSAHRETVLQFDTIDSGGQTILDPAAFRQLRRDEANNRTWTPGLRQRYLEARRHYKVVDFLNYFGFFDALRPQRDARRVVLGGISREALEGTHYYRKAGTEHSRIMGLLPVREASDTEILLKREHIRSFIQNLDERVKESPLIRDGEFARVLGYELGLNIIEHAGKDWKGSEGALGAISMRVVSPDLARKIPESFAPIEASPSILAGDRGFLEVCVGDRGIGINSSLLDPFRAFLERFGKGDRRGPVPDHISLDDVVSFAFDEFGTRKHREERWGGVHALHRILRCTTHV